MATRAARAAASSPLIGTVVRGVSKPRWASSSSTFNSSTTSPGNNPDKKITDRLSGVIDAVNDRKLPPELRGQRNAVRSETDITNVVEQRIWHSMEEGQFENLPGKGKPLDLSTNPHADPAEDTLYRILSRNKCLPEWVELNKEIRSNIAEWRSALHRATVHREGGNNSKWIECSEALKVQLRSINNKVLDILRTKGEVEINRDEWCDRYISRNLRTNEIMREVVFRYNLIVPFGRQMFGLKWEKELDRLNEKKADC